MLEDQLRRDLMGAFQNRALLYRDIYREMAAAFGPEAAERVLSRAIYARGKATAEAAFPTFGPQDACGLGEAFLAASPDEGRMFPTDVTRTPGSISFKVKQCPLKTAWIAADTPADEIATLCRIAGRFDNGLFEHSGAVVETETWRDGMEGCCRITLRDRD